MSSETEALLLLPRIRIQNANMLSSPISWGFPAPSAFLGFVHSLHRTVTSQVELRLGSVGIICHEFDPQVFQPPGRRTNVLRLTRNPVCKGGATGSIVEEGRVHLEVTLLVGVAGEALYDGTDRPALARRIHEAMLSMRIAGGSILPGAEPPFPPLLVDWPEDREGRQKLSRTLRRRLLPGFALVERQDLLTAHLEGMRNVDETACPLDALLDLCRINVEPESPDGPKNPDDEVRWLVRRRFSGWLVPVPLGFSAISKVFEPGEVANTRDPSTPFRFVESVVGLGQWISPHRIASLDSLLWHYKAAPEHGVYECRNSYADLEIAEGK